eukprot:CAMPEP_0202964530 /NCGR_PEP_ID=MMETSP1396-20130829/8612_1 /ASSEMBLY_ACC=CAM_ASM_000872 /TAXON_ID= /ORGANISM="Pseudokeronopsis sp., Strain Brazil" /LENGTH=115 /DNA_ID=CAMNT_0049686701 /DNA_START=685 /DNA_END=1032 /DNA_ORIENTATION=-
MTLLDKHIVLCMECIKDPEDKARLIKEITDPSISKKVYQILEISFDEVEGMCANMFNLLDQEGRNTIIMSARANRSYRPENLKILEQNYKILVANIDNIEHVGGGSCRCMIAEKY